MVHQAGSWRLCSAMRNFSFLLGFIDGNGLNRSLKFSGRHLKGEVMCDHQHIDGQLKFHPPGAQTSVRAQPVRRVPGTAVLITRRQIAVDIEFEGVGEDVSSCNARPSGQ